MRSLLREEILFLNLLHQAVEALVNLVLMCNLYLPFVIFEDLDIRVDSGAEPVLLGLVSVLALTLSLHLPAQEL
jgi:hypothetical protein